VRQFARRQRHTDARLAPVRTGHWSRYRASEAAAALVPWVCDALPSPNSRKAYHDDLKAFVSHVAKIGVHPFAVTGDHVRIYKEAMVQAGRKPVTIGRALSVIRGTYEQFGKKGLVGWNIVGDIQAVTSPRVDKNTTPGMSEQEACRLPSHTTTPWHVGLSECSGVYGGEQHWAILCPNANGIIADVEGGLGAKSKANAEFIVRACNNHEELLTACKMSLQDAKDALSGEWEPATSGWESIVEHLTRVIAKAEETIPRC